MEHHSGFVADVSLEFKKKKKSIPKALREETSKRPLVFTK